jgi:hypothetical protein
MSGSSGAAAVRVDRARLARFGAPLLGLLGVEFLLGMTLDQFVSLPTGSPASILAASPVLDVHLVVGALLLGFAGNILRVSIRLQERRTVAFAAVGLLSAVLAVGAGFAFAFGGQTAIDSFAMSVGFLGMVVEAGYLLWRAGPAPTRPPIPSPSGRA